MSEGRIAEDGKSVVFHQPMLEGVTCEVQHSTNNGPFCPVPGSCGVGVVTLPTGQPRLVLQVKHADGSSLGATLTASLAGAMLECLVDAMAEAERIAAAASAARARAS